MRGAPVAVVGAGLGALRTAESLRRHGFDGPVVVLGDEPWLPYSRPPLTKEALAGGISHETLAFRLRADLDVEWRLGVRVVGADLEARTLTTGDGDVVDWTALVVASGVRPRRLEDVGVAAPAAGVARTVVRTLEEAAALQHLLRGGSRLAVIGAGFIGCEVAATARTLGCVVDVVAVDPEPMVRPLGPALGAEVRRRHERDGVRFHLGRTPVAVEAAAGGAARLLLDDGTVVEADVVVEALGSDPTPPWLDDDRLDLADGVLVDAALRPLLAGRPRDGVAVVGDLAHFPNPRFGDGAWRVEHWSIPTDTGRRAGEVLAALLAGGQGPRPDAATYREAVGAAWQVLPTFWSDQGDVHLLAYGMPGLADDGGVHVLEGDLDGDLVMGYRRGGDLVGVVGLGALRATHAYRDRIGIGH